MKKLLALILALLMMIAVLVACDNGDDTSSSTGGGETSSTDTDTSSTTPPADDTSSSTTSNNTNKYPDVPKIDYNVNINQTINTNIFANLDQFGNEGEALAYSNAINKDVSVGITNINEPGVYRLYGTTTKGHVKIDIDRPDDTAPLEKVILVLDNVSITSYPDASSIPPIYSKGCDLTIIIPKGTTNTITDTPTNLYKGAIYVKTGNLTIEGEGSLKINAVYKNAIFNTKTLTINGGVFDLTSTYHGIYGESGLVINSGDFTINSERSAFKSGEYEETNLPEENVLGSITLNGGKAIIDAETNAIDCYGSVTVNGGGYNIVSDKDGINATGDIVFAGADSTVMIIDAAEKGIKGDTIVKVTENTNIKISSISDGIKASDVEIDTTGVLYIKTNAKFVEDKSSGEYILDNKEYHKVDRALYQGKAFYSISGSSKGINGVNKVVIKNGTIGIDADEEAIVSTDGKIGNSETPNTITISGGTLSLDSRENAIKADNTVTLSNASISVIKADKGINARTVDIESGTVTLVAISDAIDADYTTVDGGTVYLFDKVDYPTDGTFVVNAGTVVCVSTTKNAKTPTTAIDKVLSASIANPADYVYGNTINIKGGTLDITLKLPKSYAEKLSVVVVSPELAIGPYTISAGTYTNGSVANLVCTGGTFTAISSETTNIQ